MPSSWLLNLPIGLHFRNGQAFTAAFCPQTLCGVRQQVGTSETLALPACSWVEGADSVPTTGPLVEHAYGILRVCLALVLCVGLGNPLWRKTSVMTQYMDLRLLALSDSFFYLPLRLKLITPSWRRAFIPVKQDGEAVKSRGSLFHLQLEWDVLKSDF